MIPGRCRIVAGLAAITLSLAGCGIPSAGPVRQETARRLPVNPGVQIAPAEPATNAPAATIVEGFLHAMAAYESDYTLARRYLTPPAAAEWDPSVGVTVYAAGYSAEPRGESIVLDAPEVGRLNPDGTYRQSDRRLQHDFKVVRDPAGQWRISDPPSGLVLSASLFDTSVLRSVIYYWADGGEWLVPDPRYFPRGPRAREATARAVLEGPSAWLVSAVERGPSILLSEVTVSSTGGVTVGVTTSSGALGEKARERILTQLVWSFRQFRYVSSVAVVQDGTPWSVPGYGTDPVPTTAYPDADPVSRTTSEQLFTASGGRLARVVDGTGGLEKVGVAPGADDVVTAAVSPDAAQAATVDAARRMLSLAALTERNAVPVLTGTRIGRPHFSRRGELWVPTGGGVKVRVDDRWTDVRVGGAPDGDVTGLRVSPDGARLALTIRRSDGRCVAGIARIGRRGGVIQVSGWSGLAVRLRDDSTPSVLDLGWSTDDALMALVEDDGLTAVVESTQEGARQRVLGPAGQTGLVELAVAPHVTPVVRLASGGTLRYSSNERWLSHVQGSTGVLYAG